MKEKKTKSPSPEKIPSLALKEPVITAEGWKRRLASNKPKTVKKSK